VFVVFANPPHKLGRDAHVGLTIVILHHFRTYDDEIQHEERVHSSTTHSQEFVNEERLTTEIIKHVLTRNTVRGICLFFFVAAVQ
jgi:hypothetical protein